MLWSVAIPSALGGLLILIAVIFYGTQLIKLGWWLLKGLGVMVRGIWIFPAYTRAVKTLKARGIAVDYTQTMQETIDRIPPLKPPLHTEQR
jgi:Zn-dependent membrane protease YugP